LGDKPGEPAAAVSHCRSIIPRLGGHSSSNVLLASLVVSIHLLHRMRSRACLLLLSVEVHLHQPSQLIWCSQSSLGPWISGWRVDV
jgi:hypothetical protein